MSLVLELQHDILNPSIAVSTLLRKALVVAKKLSLQEFADWAELEINGYIGKEPPEYRSVKGIVKCWNPYYGWQPLFFPNDELEKVCTQGELRESASELEGLLASGEHDSFTLSFSPKAERALQKGINQVTSITLHINSTDFRRVLEKVRSTILNWTLELEKDGILGESMTFSKEEKAAAAAGTIYNNVNNFYASVSNQQIQQGNESAIQHITNTSLDATALTALKTLVADLRGNLSSLGISSNQAAELEADIGTIECQTNSTKPKINILKESLASIRKVLESATGGVVANQIYTRIPEILQLLG